ncbi:MAG TPA: Calx-beta domain-containing protein [Thermoanaerobaculia bacterium]|nr:Calx-beta domain-containing protein [Thermoanaerobaculia bacterium]
MRCLALATAICIAALALPATADDFWIAPGEKADVTLGDWGVTPTGEAHFSFTVPAAFSEFVGAQVFIIGKKNKSLTYELHLSISQDGAQQNAFNSDVTGLPLTIATDRVNAVDASALFPALAPGADIVALHFKATSAPDLRVIGLRFQYTRIPDQAGLSCGAGEFLVGFDAAGAPICDDRSRLLANLACPNPGEFVSGFDGDGNLVCGVPISGGGGDDDILIAINDVEGVEGNTGTSPSTPFVFTVSLTEPAPSTITVDYATNAIVGGATPGTDFTAASGTVTFLTGESTKPVTIDVVGDADVEDTEEFLVVLSNATGPAVIGDGEGRGRIFDDDNDGRDP